MITAPYGTPSFYVLNLEEQSAKTFMRFLLPKENKHIDKGYITSADFADDISATNELQTAMKDLAARAYHSSMLKETIEFNPLYLPGNSELLEKSVELDQDGNIDSIAGFKNPFIVMNSELGPDVNRDEVQGRVAYKQFELPAFEDMLLHNGYKS